jgi:hypothetical protein
MIDISIKLTVIMHITLLATNSIAQPVATAPLDSIEVNGMTFSWAFDRGLLQCEASAPTAGWVAVGFNTKNELKGTNLIMGAIEQEFLNMEDQYIVKPGDHRSVIRLGGSEAVTKRGGKEENGITTISFSLPQLSSDKLHHQLIQGIEYYVLLAFSQEDDFQHHSIMRTTIKLKL